MTCPVRLMMGRGDVLTLGCVLFVLGGGVAGGGEPRPGLAPEDGGCGEVDF
jgi:hypothetical protein